MANTKHTDNLLDRRSLTDSVKAVDNHSSSGPSLNKE